MVFPRPFYRWRPHPWHGLEVGPARLTRLLQDVRAHLDGEQPEASVPETPTISVAPNRDLPELEAGFYLYEDVILGVVDSVLPLVAAQTTT